MIAPTAGEIIGVSGEKKAYVPVFSPSTRTFPVSFLVYNILRENCGVRSGRDEDKFKAMGLTKGSAREVKAPVIMESPVNIGY